MRKFTKWLPLTNPVPVKTFPKRLLKKWRFLIGEVFCAIGTKMGLFGAKVIGVVDSGNTLLQLNKDYALGRKGSFLELPRDQVIYRVVKRHGFWELEESKFLANGLVMASRNSASQNVALIDIGAHAGLVTLQAINLSHTKPKVFLFEPVPRHVSAIKQNLRNVPNIHLNEFALSDKNGQAEIYTEEINHGNSSLLDAVVSKIGRLTTQVQLVETSTYFSKYLNNFDSYVIKCDAQGMDSLILSRIPERIWRNCQSAVIEVTALEQTSRRDVNQLLSMFKEFAYISWQSNSEQGGVTLNEVSEFWLNGSGSFRNLFLCQEFN